MLEAPIRDSALKIEHFDVIDIGLVKKSDAQTGKKVTGRDEDYIWEGFEFGDGLSLSSWGFDRRLAQLNPL
jgi:hypothetical protein